MKTILVIAVILAPALCGAQLFVDFGFGLSGQRTVIPDHVEHQSILPLSDISVGYKFNNLVVEGEIRPTLSRLANSPNNLGAKIGYSIKGFVPALGYYFNECSDNPDYNTRGPGYSLKYITLLKPEAGIYFEGMYVNKAVQFTAGIHYNF